MNTNETHDLVYVYEGAQARLERSNKRLWILAIILIAALILSNVAWIVYESQFQTITEESVEIDATQDGGGVNIVGGGDINYGADSTYQENDG